ncbi:unnamed protein product [Callosobruchus maculatus]|uniref:Uncharacterized protein n=1 Tax=Callosobruchus maculatus TaxID=64391 RepID=A0A653DGX3_CALMS|nr:unnamed protein product [Callosobruchus maculatus]
MAMASGGSKTKEQVGRMLRGVRGRGRSWR